ncbi:probable F-box protein At4g22165 [Abrus precatorius]|uniref:Probable F-box protein At4g22165 n=1 Tax=Abrus precatorius TaxID=3816 RepID=A0A8B8KJL8_ABRPR|nr:probable F-box protein At4g22165 [Abrus precatorius]
MEMEGKAMKKKRDWSQMPKDIVEMFYKQLAIPDQVGFSKVCKAWHSSTSNKAKLHVPDTPWLITNDDTSSLFKIFSSTHRKTYKILKPFKPSGGSFIAGSFKGWLVIRSPVKVFILNLFSKFRIELPPQTTMPDFLKPKRDKPIVSDFPLVFAISTCESLNPVTVAAATFCGDLVWCKIGDRDWKGYSGDDQYRNLTFHNDKLYAITQDGIKIDTFRVDESESRVLLKVGSITCPSASVALSDHVDMYLVESNKSLLVLKRYYERSRIQGPTIGFDVFKVQENSEVVNVNGLGDQALFVSDLNCESVAFKECPQMLEADRIYFIGHSANGMVSELGVFSVKDKCLRFRVPLVESTMISPIWVLPRFPFACDCKSHGSSSKRKRATMFKACASFLGVFWIFSMLE